MLIKNKVLHNRLLNSIKDTSLDLVLDSNGVYALSHPFFGQLGLFDENALNVNLVHYYSSYVNDTKDILQSIKKNLNHLPSLIEQLESQLESKRKEIMEINDRIFNDSLKDHKFSFFSFFKKLFSKNDEPSLSEIKFDLTQEYNSLKQELTEHQELLEQLQEDLMIYQKKEKKIRKIESDLHTFHTHLQNNFVFSK